MEGPLSEICLCSRNRDTFFRRPASQSQPLAEPLTPTARADASTMHRTSSALGPEEPGAPAGGQTHRALPRARPHGFGLGTGSAPRQHPELVSCLLALGLQARCVGSTERGHFALISYYGPSSQHRAWRQYGLAEGVQGLRGWPAA